MQHRKVRAQLPSLTRRVKRTHRARECLKALLDKDSATPYQTGAVQSFGDAGPNGERFAAGQASGSPELRAKSLGIPGLLSPSRGSGECCVGPCWRRERPPYLCLLTSACVHKKLCFPWKTQPVVFLRSPASATIRVRRWGECWGERWPVRSSGFRPG